MNMEWSPKQAEALAVTARWMRDPDSQVLCLFGSAGTGKTTLAKYLVEHSDKIWLFVSFTGKACSVMRSKGCYGARTVHSLIYASAGDTREQEINLLESRLRELRGKITDKTATSDDLTEVETRVKQLTDARAENRPRFRLWPFSRLADDDVAGVVADEISMIDDRLGQDLESFGKKVLALGDPAQLPPVGAGGYYTRRMPDVMLTEVHRQARDSGIIALATHVREGGVLADWKEQRPDVELNTVRGYGGDYLRERMMQADQILVGTNNTRRKFNHRYREVAGRRGVAPEPGERLICLRNDRDYGVYNGSMWTVTDCEADSQTQTMDLVLRPDDGGEDIRVPSWMHHITGHEKQLTEMGPMRRDLCEFTWAYNITVHKAQGSQWDDVVLFDETAGFGAGADSGFARRWIYTGITRAAKRLTIVTQ